MRSDLRTAFRALRSSPGFTAVALVVLALGIGATTAIFSVVDAVMLRGLPFDDADGLVSVQERDLKAKTGPGGLVSAAPTFMDWKARQDVFESLAATAYAGGFTVRDDGRPLALRAQRVSASLFSLLRVPPQLGSPFTEANEIEGNERVVVLSDALWRQRFNADPNIVGTTIAFDRGAWVVAAVMPPGFTYPVGQARPVEIWVPYVVPADERARDGSRSYYLNIIGRLRPGVSMARADARMNEIMKGLALEHPSWYADRGALVRTLHEFLVGSVRSWMWMLLASVGFVLLIACANVANLMLTRAMARAREVGIRAALGATRWQLVRALLVEGLMLSTAGTLLGLLLAWWGIGVLRAALPASLPRVTAIAIDWRVLLAAAAAAIVTGLVFGLIPALQASRPSLVASLREGGRSGSAGAVRQRMRNGLLVAEVALAVVLLVGAGLFLASFVRMTNVDLGVDYRHVLTFGIYPDVNYQDAEEVKRAEQRRLSLLADIGERVRRVDGVEVVGWMSGGLPLSGASSRTNMSIPGRPGEFKGESVDVRSVSPDLFAALRMPLRAGRLPNDADRTGTEPVIVLNQAAVKKYFAGVEPLGAMINLRGTRKIIGVVGDNRQSGPSAEARPEGYVPITQTPGAGADLVIRTRVDPQTLVPAVKAAIWSVLPTLSLNDQTLQSFVDRMVAQRRFNMLLIGLFGILAIVIASVGIYGVMAYMVEQRSAEIGVRMALGALPGGILRMVLGRATLFMIIGLAAGLPGSWFLGKFVEAFLFNMSARTPLVYVAIASLLLAVGLVAAFIPARRAARIDPATALRA